MRFNLWGWIVVHFEEWDTFGGAVIRTIRFDDKGEAGRFLRSNPDAWIDSECKGE